MGRHRVLTNIDAAGYEPHALHREPYAWIEKNCYVDIWIELLQSLGLEPVAMFPFTLGIDFEGDQWTFLKPPLDELRDLYGLDVQEMSVWRPLIEHAAEHLDAGKLLSTEADAYWLPDTASTDYRRQHTKTTIVVNDLDTGRQRLGYFHNAGYYSLEGEDFRQLLRLDVPADAGVLPLYAELVRCDKIVRLGTADLAAVSARLLCGYVERRPTSNPVRRFAARLERDLPQLLTRGLPYFHAWAFATIRQLGSAFELLAAHLRWQSEQGILDAEQLLAAARQFDVITQSNKTLILKIARAVNTCRPFDSGPGLEEMALAWDDGVASLVRAL